MNLQDFGFVPLHIKRLQQSKAWLKCKRRPELAYYLLNLWMRAWHELPAGSIECDDDVLADAAMCEPRKWLKLKDDLLRGWIECSDGRIYHPVVAELAKEAWAEKLAHRARTKAATEARERKRQDLIAAEEAKRDEQRGQQKSGRDDQRNEQRDVHQGKGRGKGQGEGQGKGEGEVSKTKAHAVDSPADALPAGAGSAPASSLPGENPEVREASLRGALAKALRDEGVTNVAPSHPTITAWVQRGVTVQLAREAVDIARDKKPKPQAIPLAYLEPIVEQLRNPAPANGKRGNGTAGGSSTRDWWDAEETTRAKARELAVPGADTEDLRWLRCAIAVKTGGDQWPWIDPRNQTQQRWIEELKRGHS